MERTTDHRMPRRRRRPRLTLALAVVLSAGAVSGAAAALHAQKAPHTTSDQPLHLDTVKVTRSDLSSSQSLPGTLGHGRAFTLKSKGTGTLTEVPAPGTRAARGKALFWVDDQPVPVFFGGTPFFRPLDRPGIRGHDVRVLADNLRELGYAVGETVTRSASPLPPGQAEFTSALSDALKRWQHDTGQKATGTLSPDRALVLPGPVRIETVTALPGDPVGADVLTYTTTAKTVAMKMDATDAGAVRKGQAVLITLPDARVVPGKVTAVSPVVQGTTAQGPDAQTESPTVVVTVTPEDADGLKAFDSASVQVRFTTPGRKDVLVVPVTALLALREGGYALQRTDSSLLAVTTGMFADGLVEVSGPGIREGLVVVTSS
ncbi:hypothetical protein ACIQPQ_16035 [Streptomyces sp. NPDC091281]|uniref:hypothetical protein n=1 Tax=Streptomyces sp. NPDC091281 TaxID=3365985 RepID=UPI0037FC36C2